MIPDDDLDAMFPDEAIDEFVKGINVDFGEDDEKLLEKLKNSSQTKEDREVFAAVIVENDDMLKRAIFGV